VAKRRLLLIFQHPAVQLQRPLLFSLRRRDENRNCLGTRSYADRGRTGSGQFVRRNGLAIDGSAKFSTAAIQNAADTAALAGALAKAQ